MEDSRRKIEDVLNNQRILKASEFMKQTNLLYSELKSYQTSKQDSNKVFMLHPIQFDASEYSGKQLVNSLDRLKALNEGF